MEARINRVQQLKDDGSKLPKKSVVIAVLTLGLFNLPLG